MQHACVDCRCWLSAPPGHMRLFPFNHITSASNTCHRIWVQYKHKWHLYRLIKGDACSNRSGAAMHRHRVCICIYAQTEYECVHICCRHCLNDPASNILLSACQMLTASNAQGALEEYLQDFLNHITGVDSIHLFLHFGSLCKTLQQCCLNKALIQLFQLLSTLIHLIKVLHSSTSSEEVLRV